jgi:hypothetical protein
MTEDIKPVTSIDEHQFAALTNFMWSVLADSAATPERCGDILYRHANPMVDDESRMLARVLMAYLGLRFDDPGLPRHEPGSGCVFAQPDGTCEYHAISHANAIVDEVAAEMRPQDTDPANVEDDEDEDGDEGYPPF